MMVGLIVGGSIFGMGLYVLFHYPALAIMAFSWHVATQSQG